MFHQQQIGIDHHITLAFDHPFGSAFAKFLFKFFIAGKYRPIFWHWKSNPHHCMAVFKVIPTALADQYPVIKGPFEIFSPFFGMTLGRGRNQLEVIAMGR